MDDNGILYTISGPSGAGKSSLVQELVKKLSNIRISVSHTTRPPRPAEQDGVHYHFIDQQVFEEMRRKSVFLEYAQVFGNFYGSSRKWVEQTLSEGEDVILEIDWQGAQQVRTQMPQSVSIFLLPPGASVLRQRLSDRGHNHKLITARMECAAEEMRHFDAADYLVINKDFTQALTDLSHIILSNRLRCAYSRRIHRRLIEELTEAP